MSAKNRVEKGGLTGESVNLEEVMGQRRVERVEFILAIHDGLHALKLMAASHNHLVAILEALISQAKALESIPGVKVNYYYSEKIQSFAVEAEEKQYAFAPVEMVEDEEFEVPVGEGKVADDEFDLDANFDDFEQIDSVDFFIGTEQRRNSFVQLAAGLNEQIQSLSTLLEEVEDYECEPGIQLKYYINDETNAFGYLIEKKPPMGFAGMIER